MLRATTRRGFTEAIKGSVKGCPGWENSRTEITSSIDRAFLFGIYRAWNWREQGTKNWLRFRIQLDVLEMAEGVGFEPTYRLLTDNSISSRARYGRFATPPRRMAESRRANCHSGIGETF